MQHGCGTMWHMQFIERLTGALASMRPSESAVTRRILREPERVARHSLRELAAWCQTSDTTVLRACRAAGFDGYQDLKFHVLRELTGPVRQPAGPDADAVLPVDDLQASWSACEGVLLRAAKILCAAERVSIVGSGASGGVGMILADVLASLGKHTLVLTDDTMFNFVLSSADPRLVLVAISHSGESSLPLRAVLSAAQQRVRTIGITNDPASELAKCVDVLLTTDVVERPEGSFSIIPRMCQLVVCDRLVEAIISKQHELGRVDRPRRAGRRTVR